ncbi:MAG: LPS export ABC transporter permease LptF [Gammaproteobacteria bacterium]|nr:LPS export ABC transporter permease LptF [Gammaproteobacteria bacterium]
MTILDRYIFREVSQAWLAVTGVLLVILVGNQFARILGDAAVGKLPRDDIFWLLGLTSLNYLTVLVPVALFLSVMLAMGRFYRDSEMAAIVACGVGPRTLYRPMAVFAIAVAVALGALSMEFAPWALRQISDVKEQARQEAEVGALAAGRFRSTGEGVVFYAQSVTADGRLKDVFLERQHGDAVEVVVAEFAEQKSDPARKLRLMILYNGTRYEGIPGNPGFRTVQFEEHGIPILSEDGGGGSVDVEALPLAALLERDDADARAEFQWRLSAPLSALLLVLLALPLSRSTPRQGRYAKLTMAVLIYVLYSNLTGAAKVWLQQGKVPGFIGIWWVHLAMFLFSLVLLYRNFGPGSVQTSRRKRGRREST